MHGLIFEGAYFGGKKFKKYMGLDLFFFGVLQHLQLSLVTNLFPFQSFNPSYNPRYTPRFLVRNLQYFCFLIVEKLMCPRKI